MHGWWRLINILVACDSWFFFSFIRALFEQLTNPLCGLEQQRYRDAYCHIFSTINKHGIPFKK